MANLQQVLLASLESVAFYSVNNDAVRQKLHQAKAALQTSLKYNSETMKKRFFLHLAEAQSLVKASMPIDYTPKGGWPEADPWFFSAPSKQELDVEDSLILPRVYVDSEEVRENRLLCVAGRSKNSKSKAKWSRTGRTARHLSNR